MPASGVITPSSISSVVVFPAPFGPSRPTRAFCGTTRSIPSTAAVPRKRFVSKRGDDNVDVMRHARNLTVPLRVARGHFRRLAATARRPQHWRR